MWSPQKGPTRLWDLRTYVFILSLMVSNCNSLANVRRIDISYFFVVMVYSVVVNIELETIGLSRISIIFTVTQPSACRQSQLCRYVTHCSHGVNERKKHKRMK